MNAPRFKLALFCLALAWAVNARWQTARAIASRSNAPSGAHKALIEEYCVGCHNQQTRTAGDELPGARKIIGALARRAFRRPVTLADVNPLLAFYETGRKAGDFDAGNRHVVYPKETPLNNLLLDMLANA